MKQIYTNMRVPFTLINTTLLRLISVVARIQLILLLSIVRKKYFSIIYNSLYGNDFHPSNFLYQKYQVVVLDNCVKQNINFRPKVICGLQRTNILARPK